MRQSHPLILCTLVALGLSACGPAPGDRTLSTASSQTFRPLAQSTSARGSLHWDEDSQRTYLAVPARLSTPRATSSAGDRNFSKMNWSYSVKQKGRVQVYIVQTPDWYEVVEQELPRFQKDFNQVDEAIAYANGHYGDWDLVSLEP